jgi:phosphocarrier protein HPr
MIKKITTISNKLGLHARASAKLTKLAGSFPCEVWLSAASAASMPRASWA